MELTSGITAGDNPPVYFPQPKVNVKAELPLLIKKLQFTRAILFLLDEEILKIFVRI